MIEIKDYPAWMKLPPEALTVAPERWRISPHAFSLAVTLSLAWFYVIAISAEFEQAAYQAVKEQDFSGLGAGSAELDIRLILLPLMGFLLYWATRLAIGMGRWLWTLRRQ